MDNDQSPLQSLRQRLTLTTSQMAVVCGCSIGEWSKAERGIQRAPQRVWDYLGELGYSPQAVEELQAAHERFRSTVCERLRGEVRERCAGQLAGVR